MVESIARVLSEVNIEEEMRKSYLDYAMSVIVGRALPDVRDGLKPVHRRVLYAMHDTGLVHNKPHRKSAKVVGEVIGNYHPHGETAVYDTIVRMAQDFSLRYTLVDGHGNFGSVDGDSPAAMRYTNVRLSAIAHEMLADLDKETVDFIPTYDNSSEEPVVLPAAFPNLLVNGSSGIAVGMATNIPPHNLREVTNAVLAIMDNPDIEVDELMQHLPGPDFPTSGIINGVKGIRDAYRTGRGRIVMRARVSIETDDSAGPVLIVTELPYQVNKARLQEKIAELVKDKKLTGIRGLRDETDKRGMRLVIELRRGETPEVVLNNLYAQTPMQCSFGANMVALDADGRPSVMNLSKMLRSFVQHRREVVVRRTLFDLRKSKARAHVLEGLAVALANIDELVALIKSSPDPNAARTALMGRLWAPGVAATLLGQADSSVTRPEDLPPEYGLSDDGYRLSEIQAKSILEMPLQRLTGLEKDKIIKEYGELLVIIQDLLDILANPARVLQIVREELQALADKYGDDRRSEIIEMEEDIESEDLIAEETLVVTLSHVGYVKSQTFADYRLQRRGGAGRVATNVREEDFVEKVFIAGTHDHLLCFSNYGVVYSIKVYRLPRAGYGARGQPMVNLLSLREGEKISAVLPVREFSDDRYVVMATRDGTVKKVRLSAFARPRANGLIAINLSEGNDLISVDISEGNSEILLFSSDGRAAHFSENDLRATGRTSKGVRGIRLAKENQLVGMLIATEGDGRNILNVTLNGYGKFTPLDKYPRRRRGGRGVISIRTGERNGPLLGVAALTAEDELMMIGSGGKLVRIPVKDISVVGRSTQGVRLINLQKGATLVGIAPITASEADAAEDDGDEEEGEAQDSTPVKELEQSDTSSTDEIDDESPSTDDGEE